MVKTTYPAMWKYVNKWSVIAYGLFFLIPIQGSVFMGHYHWKRGKLPRLAYNDQKYTKFMNAAGLRHKLLLGPALEAYPDQDNRAYFKYIKPFLKKHRQL